LVRSEYSIECRRLFGRDISGVSYTELQKAYDVAEQALHRDILVSVFQEDELQREVCLSLLPKETDVHGTRMDMQDKRIPGMHTSDGLVMVILTDISERRKLEDQVAQERQVLNMVVWVIKHYQDYKELVEQYREFALGGKDKLMMNEQLSAAEKLAELSRMIH